MVIAFSPIPLLFITFWLRRRRAAYLPSPLVVLPVAHAIHCTLHWAMLFYSYGVAAQAETWAWR